MENKIKPLTIDDIKRQPMKIRHYLIRDWCKWNKEQRKESKLALKRERERIYRFKRKKGVTKSQDGSISSL